MYAQWAVTAIGTLQSAISNGGTVFVGEDITVGAGQQFTVNKNVVLKAAHKDVTISPTTGISLFTVNGGNLTLGDGDCILTLDGNNLASTTGISVNTGTVTLKSHAIIQNCKQHGVSVGSGTFTLDGGTIKNNTSTTQGAGVYTSGKFVMNKGSITGNTGTDGGGVYINGGNGGTFEMTGGSITGNTASGYGGGVYVNGKHSSSSSTFTFNYTDGTISGNTTTGSVYDVYVMNNGVIEGTLPADTKRNI